MPNYVKVKVEGYGEFQIPLENINELMGWLSSKRAISIKQDNIVREVKDNQFTGRSLIEE